MYILQVTEENHRALSTNTVQGKFRRLDSLVNTKINTGFQFISDYTKTIANEHFSKLLFVSLSKQKDGYLNEHLRKVISS